MVAPIVAGAAPVGAASAGDSDARQETFTPQGGGSVQCTIAVQHTVNTDTGDLLVLLTSPTAPACQGTIGFVVQYVDNDGDAKVLETESRNSSFHDLTLHDAGSTAVTVDYSIFFDSCESNCVHTFQTKTK